MMYGKSHIWTCLSCSKLFSLSYGLVVTIMARFLLIHRKEPKNLCAAFPNLFLVIISALQRQQSRSTELFGSANYT